MYSPQQALDDPHIRAAGLLDERDYPGVDKTVPIAPTPIDLSDTPGTYRRRAPLLGEHTDEILREPRLRRRRNRRAARREGGVSDVFYISSLRKQGPQAGS